MCGEFERTFGSYEVKDIVWPELSPDELARLRGMPFRGEALETELIASQRIRLMVEAQADQIVRDAIAMQAYEDSRHAELFASLIKHYAIAVPDLDGYTPRDPEWDSCGWDMARCSMSFRLRSLQAGRRGRLIFRTRLRRYLKS